MKQIILDKEQTKRAKEWDVNIEELNRHAIRFLKAVKAGKLVYVNVDITQSRSTIKVREIAPKCALNFHALIYVLAGYNIKTVSGRDCIVIGGVGLNRIDYFHNQIMMRRLVNAGCITKKAAAKLNEYIEF